FELLKSAAVTCNGAVEFPDNPRLQREKFRARFRAVRRGFSNCAAVLIQNRKRNRKADRPFVCAAVKHVARREMHVWILLRDLDPERGFGRCVIFKRGENVSAISQSFATQRGIISRQRKLI